MQADPPAADVIAKLLTRMRDDAGQPILPMAPGTALCLACPWVPWPWQDLAADVQARQHSQQSGHPTLYPTSAAGSAGTDRDGPALRRDEPPGESVAAVLP